MKVVSMIPLDEGYVGGVVTEVDDVTLFLSNNSHASCFVNTITSTCEASPHIHTAGTAWLLPLLHHRGTSTSVWRRQFYRFPDNTPLFPHPGKRRESDLESTHNSRVCEINN